MPACAERWSRSWTRPLAVYVVVLAAGALVEAPVAVGEEPPRRIESQNAVQEPAAAHVQPAQAGVDVPLVLLVLLLAYIMGFAIGRLWRRPRTRRHIDVRPPAPLSPSRAGLIQVAAAIALLAGAEVVLAEGYVLVAQIADAVLVVLLVNAGRRDEGLSRVNGFDPSGAAIRALAVVALVRVVGIGLPLREVSDVAGDILLAILIGVAAVRMAAAVGVSIRALLAVRSVLVLLSTAAGGVALGVGAYLVGAPALASQGDGAGVIVPVVAAATIAAMAEELVFRGLVQVSFQRLWGGAGAVAATGVFVSTYISFGSVSLLLVMALAGLVFAGSVMRTGALGAAAVGHVLFVAAAAIACPLLFGPRPSDVPPQPVAGLALGAAVLLGAAILWRGFVAPVARPRMTSDIRARPSTTRGLEPTRETD